MEFVKAHEIKIASKNTRFKKVTVGNSQDIYNFVRKLYKTDLELYESFYLVILNRANEITGYAKISMGGVNGTFVDPRIIAKYAVDLLACGIILVHNHPSGSMRASEADRDMTRKVRECMSFFDITLLDHLILTNKGYVSFADECFI